MPRCFLRHSHYAVAYSWYVVEYLDTTPPDCLYRFIFANAVSSLEAASSLFSPANCTAQHWLTFATAMSFIVNDHYWWCFFSSAAVYCYFLFLLLLLLLHFFVVVQCCYYRVLHPQRTWDSRPSTHRLNTYVKTDARVLLTQP